MPKLLKFMLFSLILFWHLPLHAAEYVGSTLSILLHTAHPRNVENALNGQIEFIEQITKSLGK